MRKAIQFIKFGLVGISNTLISELIYVIVICLHGHYVAATFLGFSISVLNAYYWGNKYVFTQQEDEVRVWWKVLIKTYIAYAGGFVLDVVLLFLWIDVLQIGTYMQPIADILHRIGWNSVDTQLIGQLLAKALNIILIVPINFIMNKYWAYRQK